jgi:hypothetical protein
MEQSTATGRADWMRAARFGVTTHYFPKAWGDAGSFARAFDVERVADQCAEAGAGWFMLTLHHQPWMMLAPNARYDARLGREDGTAERDLPADLEAALTRRGIRLMLYLNLRVDPDAHAPDEVAEALGGWPPSDALFDGFAEVYRVFAERYGDRVVGWWIDGAWISPYKQAPDAERERWFGKVAAALRAGNPDAAVAFNPGLDDRLWRYSAHNDYLAGEAGELTEIPEGPVFEGAQWHAWTYVGPSWGSGSTRFDTEQLADWARQVTARGGAVSLEVGTLGITKSGGKKDGKTIHEGPMGAIDPRQVEQLERVGEAVGNR